jgi:hypothetical protein
VADKFHLIKNIQDRFIKVLSEHYDEYRLMARTEENISESPIGSSVISINDASCSTITHEKADSRQIMFNEVKELQMKGFRPATISKQLSISRQTATKYCSMESLPKRKSKSQNGYEKFDRYVETEILKGKAM